MSFSFQPMSDEEINAIQNQGLLADGDYPFVVKEVKEACSQAGNTMLKVRIGIIDNDGYERNIFDHLIMTDKWMFKFKHFCQAIGLESEYNAGKLEYAKCLKRSGKVKIATQKGESKGDNMGFYPDKNIVKDYLSSLQLINNTQQVTNNNLNDDINY